MGKVIGFRRPRPTIDGVRKSDEHGSRGVGSLRRPGFCWLEYLLLKSVFQWSDVASKATSARIPANGSITLPARNITRKRRSIGSKESVGSARRPMLKKPDGEEHCVEWQPRAGTTGSSAFRWFSPQPLRSRPTWNAILGSRLWVCLFWASLLLDWCAARDAPCDSPPCNGGSYQLIEPAAQDA